MPLDKVDDPRRLRQLIGALLIVGSDLSLPVVLRHIVEAAVAVVDARYGALGVLDEDGHGLAEFIHVGIGPDDARIIGHLPEGHGILGLLILEPKPLRLADLSTHPDSYGFPPNHPPMRSFLGVPITIRSRVYGNLYLTEKRDADEFAEEDESLALVLAQAAAIAIDNARLLEKVRDLGQAHDRERIAADLHDRVIQHLFATGLALEATVRLVPAEAAERLHAAVEDLDQTIREIRSTIFALQTPKGRGRGLRGEILASVVEASASLGFEPRVHLEGPIDAAVPERIASDLLATLSEALSNVARHAVASRAEVHASVADGRLLAEVADDGKGVPGDPGTGGNGLVNMARRAEALGGSCSLGGGLGGRGTKVTWQVPLGAGD